MAATSGEEGRVGYLPSHYLLEKKGMGVSGLVIVSGFLSCYYISNTNEFVATNPNELKQEGSRKH